MRLLAALLWLGAAAACGDDDDDDRDASVDGDGDGDADADGDGDGDGDGDADREVDPLAAPYRDLLAASRIPAAAGFANGFPRWVRGAWAVVGEDPVERARAFLDEYAALYRQGTDQTLAVAQVHLGDSDSVILEQFWKGLPVLGGELVFQLHAGEVRSVIGSLAIATQTLDVHPRLTAWQAEELVRDLVDRPASPILSDTHLFAWDRSLADPTAPPEPRLVYLVSFSDEQILLDAHEGLILDRVSNDLEIGFEIWDAQGLDGAETDCFDGWTDLAATHNGPEPGYGLDTFVVDTMDHAQTAREFYMTRPEYGFDGFSGAGNMPQSTPAQIFAHYSTGAWYSRNCNAVQISDGAVADDVIVHEWTHAWIRWTSQLQGAGQPRILNEAFSDTMAFLATGDWILGEDSLDGTRRRGDDPPATGGFDSMDDFDPDLIYWNAGIPDKAMYLITDGGAHNDRTIAGMGVDKAFQLIYHSAATLPSTATLEQAAEKFRATAEEWAESGRFGFTAADLCDTRNAWASVGLGQGDDDCDGLVDAIDQDDDGDGFSDAYDNCDLVGNPSQNDKDHDGLGDPCDDDADGDGVLNADDNCGKANADQADTNNNGVGDVCEDWDLDGVFDDQDNCPYDANPNQADDDSDGIGDECDPDPDADGVSGDDDNCPFVANANQADLDLDGLGDACDACPNDAEEITAWSAGIPGLGIPPHPLQPDTDGDGIPDACDTEVWGSRIRVRLAGADVGPSASLFEVDGAPVTIDLVGLPGSVVELPLPECPFGICGDWIDDADALALTVEGLSDDVTVAVLDDRGAAAGHSSFAPRNVMGAPLPRPLGFLPRGTVPYRLVLVFRDTFPVGSATSMQVSLPRL